MKPWVWIAGCAVAGCVGGLAWPPPPIPRVEKKVSSWTLPALPSRAPAAEDLSASGLNNIRWEGDQSGSNDANAVWRFAGVATGATTVALIDVKGAKELARHVVGSTLPDGSRIVAITRDSISSDHGTCRRSYALYQTQSADTSPECHSAAAATGKERK